MMRFLRSSFVIARRDFGATVLSKTFIFFLLGPLFPLLLGGVFGGIHFGIADRGASIRIPHSFVNNGYRGYLEDRRPNSLGDPYQIAGRILQTIQTVPTDVVDELEEVAA